MNTIARLPQLIVTVIARFFAAALPQAGYRFATIPNVRRTHFATRKAPTMIRTPGTRKAQVLATLALAFAFGPVAATPALAVPTLQLDIEGGTYNSLSQTIVATGNPFTLYALLVPDSAARLDHTYYLAAALVPKTGPEPASLGSFSVTAVQPSGSSFKFSRMIDAVTANPNPETRTTSRTIAVTADMVYGVPPLEASEQHDGGDLPMHGVYETYFSEFQFKFRDLVAGEAAQRANVYNSQDSAGAGPTDNPDGSLYYRAFTIDIGALAEGYAIHFDLYNEEQRRNGDIDVKTFAPFSHDAQSMTSTGPASEPSPVSLPGTLVLVLGGAGVIAALRAQGRCANATVQA